MRCARLVGDGLSYYHVVSRVIDRRLVCDDDEKERFRRLLSKVADFSGIRILTYTIMTNHFHILPEVDAGAKVSEAMVLSRVGILYGRLEQLGFEAQLKRLHADGNEQAVEAALDRYRYRMNDLSQFMKTLLQRETMSYNGRHERRGTLWEGRFKSILVEGSGQALAMTAAYIDLNAVRAGIVKDPKDYRYCGYAEAVAGNWRAREGLGTVLTALGQSTNRAWNAAAYRTFVFMQGTTHQKAATSGEEFSQRASEVIEKGGTLSKAEFLHCRIRYLSDGAALGSRIFIQDTFLKHRDQFGLRRRTGPRPMRASPFRDTFSMRDLRLNPISPPSTV